MPTHRDAPKSLPGYFPDASMAFCYIFAKPSKSRFFYLGRRPHSPRRPLGGLCAPRTRGPPPWRATHTPKNTSKTHPGHFSYIFIKFDNFLEKSKKLKKIVFSNSAPPPPSLRRPLRGCADLPPVASIKTKCAANKLFWILGGPVLHQIMQNFARFRSTVVPNFYLVSKIESPQKAENCQKKQKKKQKKKKNAKHAKPSPLRGKNRSVRSDPEFRTSRHRLLLCDIVFFATSFSLRHRLLLCDIVFFATSSTSLRHRLFCDIVYFFATSSTSLRHRLLCDIVFFATSSSLRHRLLLCDIVYFVPSSLPHRLLHDIVFFATSSSSLRHRLLCDIVFFATSSTSLRHRLLCAIVFATSSTSRHRLLCDIVFFATSSTSLRHRLLCAIVFATSSTSLRNRLLLIMVDSVQKRCYGGALAENTIFYRWWTSGDLSFFSDGTRPKTTPDRSDALVVAWTDFWISVHVAEVSASFRVWSDFDVSPADWKLSHRHLSIGGCFIKIWQIQWNWPKVVGAENYSKKSSIFQQFPPLFICFPIKFSPFSTIFQYFSQLSIIFHRFPSFPLCLTVFHHFHCVSPFSIIFPLFFYIFHQHLMHPVKCMTDSIWYRFFFFFIMKKSCSVIFYLKICDGPYLIAYIWGHQDVCCAACAMKFLN